MINIHRIYRLSENSKVSYSQYKCVWLPKLYCIHLTNITSGLFHNGTVSSLRNSPLSGKQTLRKPPK